jgi:hypothetical protein
VVDVIMDQRLFCLSDSPLNGVELLRQVKAWALIFYHFYNMAEVPFGPLEPPDYRCVRLVDVAMLVSHKLMLSSPGGCSKPARLSCLPMFDTFHGRTPRYGCRFLPKVSFEPLNESDGYGAPPRRHARPQSCASQ